MAEKRIIRFEKWILKVVISYAVLIGIGWLLGRIPAERIGLSEDMFFDLRMFFMLFGPIYLTLIVKIVLTILAVIKHKEKDTAEQNRGVLLAFTAILMLANLSNAQTMADLSSGLIESRSIASYTIDREPLRGAQNGSFALLREVIYCSQRISTSFRGWSR